MEPRKCSDMSNVEIKQYLLTLENEFEAKKAKVKEMCEELKDIEEEYIKAQNEMNLRKTVF